MLKKVTRVLTVLIVVAAVVVAGILLVKHKKRKLATAPKYGMLPTPVSVAVARQANLRQTRDYLAVVEPIRIASISARITSTVEKVLHDENDLVKEGDVLAVLDRRQTEQGVATMQAQVEQARADLASNQATVEALAKTTVYWDREAQRDKTLAEKGAIPAAQAEGTADKADEILGKLNAARQKSMAIGHLIESLKRKQAELETTLDYCMIRSPFDGLVSLRLVDPGDLAVPGKDLMVVEDRSGLKLSFDVPQQDLPQVHEGLEVGYSIGGHARKATLSHLFPSLNVARMLRAEVYLDGAGTEGLSSGAYVPLQVVHGNIMNATLIPAASVIDSPDGQLHVFVANGGRLEARQIRVLGSSEDDVAVENVMEGEQVVLSTFLGWAPLSSGQKVEVVK